MNEKELKCPKDGNILQLVYESEKLSNYVKTSIYYKCPVCGLRRDLERLEIQKTDQSINVRRTRYSLQF